MGRGAWQATVHRVTQSRTGLKRLSSSKKFYILINIPHDSDAHGCGSTFQMLIFYPFDIKSCFLKYHACGSHLS